MHNSMQTNDPSAQILQKRKIRDGTDVSAWRTPLFKKNSANSLLIRWWQNERGLADW